MDSLPLELHAQIFEYACVDDGTTARSLALVSRYVRDVSEPFRYQSLAVAGLNALTQLEHKLLSLPSNRRRIRRLFLSDWTKEQAGEKTVSSDDAVMDRYDLEKALIIRILDIVAPTLETFSFVAACPFNSTSLIGYLFSLNFLNLHELAIHGFYPFPRLPHSMPRLERLHLSGNRNPHGLFLSRGLDVACPQLHELRISGLVSAAAFADEVQNVLVSCDPNAAAAHATFASTVPSILKKVILEIGPKPSSSRRFNAALSQHEKMLEIFNSLLMWEDRDKCVGVEVVDGGNSTAHPYERLRKGW